MWNIWNQKCPKCEQEAVDTSFEEAPSFDDFDTQEEIQDEPLEEAENITFEPIEDFAEEAQIHTEDELPQAEYQGLRIYRVCTAGNSMGTGGG